MDAANQLPSFQAIPDLLRTHARARPTRCALRQGRRVLSWAELDTLVDRVAASFQRDGMAPTECIAICAKNSVEYALAFLGALRAGLAVAPLAAGSLGSQLAGMVADSGARMLFTDAGVPPFETAARRIMLDDSPGSCPWSQWLAEAPAQPSPVAIQPEWPFNIIYSSGTTGAPKGIVQAHAMRWAHVALAHVHGYAPDTVSLLATSLCSNTTLVCFFPTLAHGGAVVLYEGGFDPESYLALAQEVRATHAMLVPVQYQRLMACPRFGHYDLSSFRMKFCTSAPFTAKLKADVLARWPGGLVEYYGMTEGGGSCILEAHNFPDKLHTVGRPAEGHDMRLIDENGVEVAPGEVGEVVGRSASMMLGYHNQPGKSREAEWYDVHGNRFIRTGDVGRFDTEGFLTLMDRRKDLVISGGSNVYPSDLEAVLRAHPQVEEAAVVGVPSEMWGETPVAFVVARAPSADPAALRDWANQRLGKTQRLADLCVVPELPRSEIGKVLKRQLRELYLHRQTP